jgi:hypothetical protein
VNLHDPDQQYEALRLMGLTKMVPALDINVQSALQKQQLFEEWAADPRAMRSAVAWCVGPGASSQVGRIDRPDRQAG